MLKRRAEVSDESTLQIAHSMVAMPPWWCESHGLVWLESAGGEMLNRLWYCFINDNEDVLFA